MCQINIKLFKSANVFDKFQLNGTKAEQKHNLNLNVYPDLVQHNFLPNHRLSTHKGNFQFLPNPQSRGFGQEGRLSIVSS